MWIAVPLVLLLVLVVGWFLVLTRYRTRTPIIVLSAATLVFLFLSFFRGSD